MAITTPTTKPYAISLYRRKGADGQWIELGWKVAIRRRGNVVERRMSAKKFGSMDAAFEAAMAFRDQVHHECAPLTKREVCATVRTSNTSGVPGVMRVRDGGQDYWKALLHASDGMCRSRQFSIQKYGDEAAFELAVQARLQLLETVDGCHLIHPAVKNEVRAGPILNAQVTRRSYKLEPEDHPYPQEKVSDIPGVGITNVKTTRSNGTSYSTRYWTSTIDDAAGLPKRRYFSVTKYGEEEAKRLAIDYHRHALRNSTLTADNH